MSAESTRRVMMSYWEADHQDLSMVADDVVFTLMGTDQEFRGPEAVKQMLHWFYHVAFDAKVAVTNTIFGDSQAVLEADVVGRHIGEYGGIPPTGKDFRVPLCVIYDLENDKIKRGRVYFLNDVLLRQLGVIPAPQTVTA